MTDNEFKLWLEKYGGWVLIWVITAIPVIQWLLMPGNIKIFIDIQGIFSGIAKITGLIGLVLYAINLLLAARVRWMENFFGGLNRVYIAHHLTGGIALVLLVFHPLFLMLKQINLASLVTLRDAALYILPQPIPINSTLSDFQQASAINAGIVAFFGMVFLLILTFFVKIPYRLWLFTHKFLGVSFMFAGLHVVLISSDISDNFWLKGYMLIWITIGLIAFFYRTLMSNVFVRRVPYRITDVELKNGNVVSLSMEPIEKALDYKVGQFVFVRFLWSKDEGIIKEAHPFSIASSPNESKLRIIVKSLGDFTASLKNVKLGTVVDLEGAYGKFTFTRFGPAEQVWIAGGIGITPFLGMAKSYNQSSPPVTLIYSVVSRSELLDQEYLSQILPSQYPAFQYVPYISEEQDGFLTVEKVLSICGGSLAGKEIFLCGPPAMMKSLRYQLNKIGIPNRKIHSEEFTMS